MPTLHHYTKCELLWQQTYFVKLTNSKFICICVCVGGGGGLVGVAMEAKYEVTPGKKTDLLNANLEKTCLSNTLPSFII